MKYEEINARAYDEARRHFIAMVKDGIPLEAAQFKRAEVYEAMRRSRCTHCHVEKHITDFHRKDEERPQSWCVACSAASKTQTADRDKWRAGKAPAYA